MFTLLSADTTIRRAARISDSRVTQVWSAEACDLEKLDPKSPRVRPLSALDRGMLGYHLAHPDIPLAVGYLLEMAGHPPDRESLRKHIAHRVSLAPELANRLVRRDERVFGGEGPGWVSDPAFDPANHVFEYRLSTASGRTGLLEAVNRISTRAISLATPLWQVWLISGYRSDGFAVLFRASHVQMDGIALTMAIEWLFGPAANAAASTGQTWCARTERRPGFKALGGAAFGSLGWLGRTVQLDALTSPITGQPRHGWATVDVGRLRAISRAHGTTVNDVFLAALAGAVRAWSRNPGDESHDGPAEESSPRADGESLRSPRPRIPDQRRPPRSRRPSRRVHITMPISTRRAAERGLLSNYVAGVRIGLPRGEPSASRRIEGIRRQTGRYKRYDNPGAAQRLFFEATPVRLRPKALSAGFSSASVAFTASNIGRLPERLDVLGRPVVAARPLVPLCGGQRLAVVLGGLGETLYVGFIADAGIPHPATLVSLILAELDELEAASHPLPTAHDQNRSLRVRRRDGAN